MTIPSEINELVNRLNREIEQLEQETASTINIAREIIEKFPENEILTGMFSFLNNVIFLIQIERERISRIIESISLIENVTEEQIQEAGQDLSYKLGRLIEAKLKVNNIKQRLEYLQ